MSPEEEFVGAVAVPLEDEDEDLATDGVGPPATVPTFGAVSVTSCGDVHFGNKTVYQGPVTIRQLVYTAGGGGGGGGKEAPLPLHAHNKGPGDAERRGALKECLARASRRRGVTAAAGLLSLVVVAGICGVATLLLLPPAGEESGDQDKRLPTINTGQGSGELFYNRPSAVYNTTLSGKLRILIRHDWLAQPATEPYSELQLPVPYVIISHTATEPCLTQAGCVFSVRTTQTFHIESKGWSDIAYNFLVGGDGYVYTGRGWANQGAHTFGYNTCSIGISLIGTFLTKHPTDAQFLAMKQLIEEGVRLGVVRPDYKLLGHRQLSKTESPGQALFDDITELDHWFNAPVPCRDVDKLFGEKDSHPTNSSNAPS